MWPRVNRWGSRRREQLIHHIDLCTTLLPDEETCVCWADIMTESRSGGRSLTAADAWVAAALSSLTSRWSPRTITILSSSMG